MNLPFSIYKRCLTASRLPYPKRQPHGHGAHAAEAQLALDQVVANFGSNTPIQHSCSERESGVSTVKHFDAALTDANRQVQLWCRWCSSITSSHPLLAKSPAVSEDADHLFPHKIKTCMVSLNTR